MMLASGRRFACVALSIAALSTLPCEAEPTPTQPMLIQDVTLTHDLSGSEAGRGVSLGGGRTVFVATGVNVGGPLWVTDGTAEGTRDISGVLRDKRIHGRLHAVNGRALFLTLEPKTCHDITQPCSQRLATLWSTDGTVGGTTSIGLFLGDWQQAEPRLFTRVGDRAFFLAEKFGTPAAIWVTDGTAAGTRRVNSPASVVIDASPSEAFSDGSRLLFLKRLRNRLVITDGTDDGTHEFSAPTAAGDVMTNLTGFSFLGNRAIFSVLLSSGYTEVWSVRTDGQEATKLSGVGTTIPPLTNNPSTVARVGTQGFFTAFARINGIPNDVVLFTTDGTVAGTQPVPNADFASSFETQLEQGDGDVCFLYSRPGGGMREARVWKISGTPAVAEPIWSQPTIEHNLSEITYGFETKRLWLTRYQFGPNLGRRYEVYASDTDQRSLELVYAGVETLNPRAPALTLLGSRAYWTHSVRHVDGSLRISLQSSDGTPGGTGVARVQTIASGESSRHLTVLGSTGMGNAQIVYVAGDDDSGGEPRALTLERSGTPTADIALANTNSSNDPSDFRIIASNEHGAAVVRGTATNSEIWRARAAELTRERVLSGRASLIPDLSTAPGCAPRAFFTLRGSDALWSTDGTMAGTNVILSAEPTRAVIAHTSTHTLLWGRGLANIQTLIWTDGTPGGTRTIALPAVSSLGRYVGLHVDGKVLFGFNPLASRGLWETDGTDMGTRQVLATSAVCMPIGRSGNRIYYSEGFRFWSFEDPSLPPIDHGLRYLLSGMEYPPRVTNVGTDLFTTSHVQSTFERRLWKPDGSSAWLGLAAGGADPFSDTFVASVGTRVAFISAPEAHGVWTVDAVASPNLTPQQLNTSAGMRVAMPWGMVPLDGVVVGNVETPAAGLEPWITDLTTAGTKPLGDVNPGVRGSSAEQFTRVRNIVYFTADDGRHGEELWALSLCGADFNLSEQADIQDVLDFVTAWFTGSPRADINRDGAATVQDVFEFLNLWFAGCA